MRELKFRAWNGAQMAYFEPFDRVWDNEANTSLVANTEDKYQLGSDDTLMQFTGLKDMNDKEIYEGDILSVKFSGGYVERVEWDGAPDVEAEVFWDYAGFRLKAKGKEDKRYADFWDEAKWTMPPIVEMSRLHSEVIGNIHENPELLK